MSSFDIDQEALENAVTFLDQFLTSKLPQYDFSIGTANRDIAINSIALVFSLMKNDVNAIKGSLTLFDLKDKTDETSNELVDAILSDFFVERHTGDVSSGPVSLYFSTNLIGTVTVRNTDIMIKNEIEYVISTDIVFITAADLVTNTDNVGNVFYTYSLNVKAKESGSQGKAVKGLFNSWEINSPYLYQIEVVEDFSTGEDIETSSDLITRSEKALTVKNLVTQNAIYTVLMETFTFLKNVVSVGMHESEMIRDLITIDSGTSSLQVHRGSMIDIYGKFPITFRRQSSIIVTDTQGSDGIFRKALILDAIPIYKVRSVIDTNNNNVAVPFEVQVVDNALYLSGRQELFVVVSEDFLGSALQVTYDHVNSYQEVQDFVSSKAERTVVSDSLVKAHFPLYLSFDMPFYSNVDVSEAAILTTLQDYVHSGDVENELYVSSIIDVVTDTYDVTVQLPFVVTGNLLLPNGKTMVITFNDRIRTPEQYLIDNTGNYLPFFSGDSNPEGYEVGLMSDLQISDLTTRFVLDKQDVSAQRVE